MLDTVLESGEKVEKDTINFWIFKILNSELEQLIELYNWTVNWL